MSTLSKITIEDRNQLSYVAMDAVLWVCRNDEDMQRIAEHFTAYDLSDAFKLCLENGMRTLLQMCDIDDHATEAGL